ncbi:MAG TPA: histidine kinase [Pyrinomonadaceae bacterium]
MSKNSEKRNLWRIALLIFAAHTVLFVIQIPQVYLYNAQNPQAGDLWVSIARLGWGVYLWAVLTGFILWFGYRLPISRRHLRRNLFFHLLLSIVSGIIQHYGYNFGLRALNLSTAENFRASLSNLTVLFNFISTSVVRYAAVIAIQQAYFYFRESRERAFRLQQAELEMLKMQLHPHFFFNTLNAISALMYHSPKDADRMITQLGDLFRVSLKKDKAQEISLAEELEFLRSFLQIHQTLMGKRLQIEWEIEPETLDALVPNLILQPLAENAIQHGIAPLELGGRITISAAKRNEKLFLQIADDGLGFVSNGKENDGIGLANVKARLENLYNGAHKFSIDKTKDKGAAIEIEIPFRRQTAKEV